MRFAEILSEAAEPQFESTTYTKFSDLKAAIERTWGEIPELERVKITRTGSGHGFVFGRSHLIDPKTNTVVGYWELTNASMYPGRGVVTTGYGAVAKRPKTAKAPPEPKVAKPTGPAEPQDVKAALDMFMGEMRRQDSRADFRTSGDHEAEARHWGNWQVPDGEEDDGDYDWEELSDDSYRSLRRIKAHVSTKYPNVVIEFHTGEKNWIYVVAKSAA